MAHAKATFFLENHFSELYKKCYTTDPTLTKMQLTEITMNKQKLNIRQTERMKHIEAIIGGGYYKEYLKVDSFSNIASWVKPIPSKNDGITGLAFRLLKRMDAEMMPLKHFQEVARLNSVLKDAAPSYLSKLKRRYTVTRDIISGMGWRTPGNNEQLINVDPLGWSTALESLDPYPSNKMIKQVIDSKSNIQSVARPIADLRKMVVLDDQDTASKLAFDANYVIEIHVSDDNILYAVCRFVIGYHIISRNSDYSALGTAIGEFVKKHNLENF